MTTVLLTAAAYGKRVGLRVRAEDAHRARRHLPHWWQDADVEPDRVWELPALLDVDAVVGELELWVAEFAVDLIFVHAGVVAFDGRALLLPGRSFSGKTTLTAALLRAGATYGSDEYAVLDSDGFVHPYPRALSVRGHGDRARMTAASLGAASFADRMPVGGIAALQYVPGADFDVQDISKGTAVLRLFDNTVCAQTRAEAALDALVAATANSRAIAGTRGDAEKTVSLLRARFARPS